MNPKTYYIWTLGCQMNEADSERIASVFQDLDFTQASSPEDADYIVVNSCSVRQKAEDRVYGKMNNYMFLKQQNPDLKIILTGCMVGKVTRNYKKANASKIYQRLRQNLPMVDYFMDISNLTVFKKQLEQDSFSQELLLQLRDETSYLNVQPQYNKKYKAYVPIMNGCNNFCTFCIVPYARGREKSRPQSKIILEIQQLIARGCREICLVGQNVNSYKNDYNSTHARSRSPHSPYSMPFARLLHEVSMIKGDFRISFTSPHPKDFHDQIIDVVASSEKCMPWVHLPLQSGNDEILKQMRRPYTRDHYMGIVSKIRKAIPRVALATDIIVGFPGETRAQFRDTLDIVKRAGFDMAFIGRFSPRQGTEAFDFDDDITQAEKALREQQINEILMHNNYSYMHQLKGTSIRVLVETQKKTIRGFEYFGRTDGMKNIKFHLSQERRLIGNFVSVKVTKINNWSMVGELITLHDQIQSSHHSLKNSD